MKIFKKIIKDLFNISLITWIILVIMEFIKVGMVQRIINLEYYLYYLIILFIFYKILPKH